MAARRRGVRMEVKYWSSAGLLLTYWCNARCDSCYLSCGPERPERMPTDLALETWRQLIAASPHGCRVHLSGGEPFGDWPALIDLCRRARSEGLGPLEKVETNAFWATDEMLVRDRVAALRDAGMERICISADPYHQQFVPIERCRLAARVAEEVLGGDHVQVRWRDWLAEGVNTSELDEDERRRLFAEYALRGRDRLNGRAAVELGELAQRKPWQEFADTRCQEPLLRSRHVHVDPAGRLMPGTCAGILLGAVGPSHVASIWRELESSWRDRPVLGRLATGGPAALMEMAESEGFRPRADGYAGRCEFCWDLRRHLATAGRFAETLGPLWMYKVQEAREDGRALRTASLGLDGPQPRK